MKSQRRRADSRRKRKRSGCGNNSQHTDCTMLELDSRARTSTQAREGAQRRQVPGEQEPDRLRVAAAGGFSKGEHTRIASDQAAPPRRSKGAVRVRELGTGAETMIHRSKDGRVGERRRGQRDALAGKVRLLLDTQALEGEADNVSHSGILFFTDSDVRVEVEFEDGGVLRRMQGQLVRCERIRGNRRGWAVEFEQR